MSKWEDKYETYKNGGIDSIINDLTAKGISTKEEKKEYRKLTKIKEKMPQIDNVVEYRNKLKKELNDLKKEISVRENLEKAGKKQEELSAKIERYQKRYEDIVKQLKNDKLDPDKRKQLENEKSLINEDMPKVQDEMTKQEKVLGNGLGEKRQLSDLSKEELETKRFDIQTKVSKCNLVARNLLDGLSWEQIDIKLDNWKDKRFKSVDNKLETEIEALKRKREEKVNDFKLDIKEDGLDYKKEDGLNYKIEEKTNKPDLTFADKHPRLAKIGNFFKGLKDRFIKKDQPEMSEKYNPEITTVEEKNEKEEKPFKEYIKEIAEKGIDGVNEEEKTAKRRELKAKLEEMRAVNRKTEAEKFGQEYAENSDYRTNNDDEGR